jgi:hypothetical protein
MPDVDSAEHPPEDNDHQVNDDAEHPDRRHTTADDSNRDCNDANKSGYYYQPRAGERWGWSSTRQQR